MAHLPVIQPVILSGGAGTRLWPLSRKHYPKQLVALTSRHSLLQETALRVAEGGFAPPLILCNEAYRFIVAEQLHAVNIRPAGIVLEPEGRNTAPAAVMAALLAAPEAILLIMPADHVILHKDRFHAAVVLAAAAAAHGLLVTFGIRPDRPETGYGYIHRGSAWDGLPGVYGVERFVEKPDQMTAQWFLERGNYLWNSGLFVFQARRYLEELDPCQPEMMALCRMALEGASHDPDFCRLPAAPFHAVPSVSIDHAIMERTPHAVVVPVEMGWSDVGSWATLWNIGDKDAEGNVLQGDALAIDSHDSYVHSEGLLTAVVGVENLVVVATRDACLVVPRGKVQQIRAVVDRLERQKRSEAMTRPTIYRPWGCYRYIDASPRFLVKHLIVNPGERLSFQKHQYHAEHWIVVHGTASIACGENTFLLRENHSADVPANVPYRLENPDREPLQVIAVQLGTCLPAEDIVRLEEAYTFEP
ncbi:MAG: manC [Rhodospirillaceae bacterium]|nr:MAG: manC [Rhodospirillaceae bacterium]